MDSNTVVALISAASGVAVATVGAIVKGAIAQRAGTDEDLRTVRGQCCPLVWRCTGPVSTWPRADLSHTDLDRLHRNFRDWYYGEDESEQTTPGGLYLSQNARQRYQEMQELIELSLPASQDVCDVPPDVYEDLREACRAFRTALTEDLQTRRKRAVWRVLVQHRRHHRQKLEAKERTARANDRLASSQRRTELAQAGPESTMGGVRT